MAEHTDIGPCPACIEAFAEQQRKMEQWLADFKASTEQLAAWIKRVTDRVLAADALREHSSETYVGGDYHIAGCPVLAEGFRTNDSPDWDDPPARCTCLDGAVQ